jgi:undecaprenol kinase
MKNRNFIDSFKNAVEGIGTAIIDERNFRVELVIGILTLVASVLLKINTIEMMIIIVCIVLVLVAELFNSALEHLVDLFSPEYHHLAKKAKDIGAGAVLIISVGSAVIGCLIFIPYLMDLLS